MEMHFCQTNEEMVEFIQQWIKEGSFVRLQFYDEIKAFHTKSTILKNWNKEEKKLTLNDEQIIDLKNIVRINEVASPGYDQAYFKCDC